MRLNMFKVIIISTSIFVGIQGASLPAGENKIIGGKPTPIDKVPWQVEISKVETGSLFCGGSILSENYILTAAHCTRGLTKEDLLVRSGTSRREENGTLSTIASIAQHPNHTEYNFDYDVSVIKLTKPLVFGTNQQPIKLRSNSSVADEIAQVSGWGTITPGGGALPANLQSVEIPIVDHDLCADYYYNQIKINGRMLCAGSDGKSSCSGDSGGALTVDGLQVGVVSFAVSCALPYYPGVFADVIALKSFIDENSNNEAQWV